MKRLSTTGAILLSLLGGWGLPFAQDASSAAISPAPTSADSGAVPADTTPDRVLEPGKEHWFSNIDIFGESGIGSVYILMDALDLSVEMKNILTSREFSKDEFFMQNIDREEFEQERMLLLFEDRKRQFFKIFPEEKDKVD